MAFNNYQGGLYPNNHIQNDNILQQINMLKMNQIMAQNNRNNMDNWKSSMRNSIANVFNRKNNLEPILVEDDPEIIIEKPKQVLAQPPASKEISSLEQTIPSKESKEILIKQASRKIINKKVNFFFNIQIL